MGKSVAIIGAGLAGAAAARVLADAGHDVVVLEKSGGTGGRLSTRRSAAGPFDHGAQYITARSEAFKAALERLSAQDAVALWQPDGQDRRSDWYVGRPGMSGLVKPMLEDIDVRTRQTVSSVSVMEGNSQVLVQSAEGHKASYDHVIVTAPAPQAHRLAGACDPVFDALADIVYAPCWAAMIAFDRQLESIPDFWRGEDDAPSAWMVRENAKYPQYGPDRFTLHGGGQWSQAHLEQDKADIAAAMGAAFAEMFDVEREPIHKDAHRWRYARVDKALGQPFLAGADNRIIVCGDGLLGGRAEAAFQSGLAAANHIATL